MLTYDMTAHGQTPLYEYLYTCIRTDIERGEIEANQKLPSKRALAQHLGVSVITVEGAYTQLMAEGYIYSQERKGFFASELDLGAARVLSAPMKQQKLRPLPGVLDPKAKEGLISEEAFAGTNRKSTTVPLGRIADFTGKTPVTGVFPYATWAKCVREVLTSESEDTLFGELDPQGSPRLRQVLANHLRDYRGMTVDPDCIVVGAGAQILDNLLVQLLGRDRCFAVEDPGYPRLTRLYRNCNVELVHIPMDTQGVSVKELSKTHADVLHIMPSHQFPTGLVTSVARRYELLNWAAVEADRYIIEDDYDCEFRLAGKPIPALQSMDTNECVIYTNTFTKSLGQAFRIAYMVLPQHLMDEYRRNLGFYSSTVSAVDQLALARFIETGDYERHVNRMRTICRTKRNHLLDTLRSSVMADRLVIANEDSGLHFLMGMDAPEFPSDVELAAAARELGVGLAPLSHYCSDLPASVCHKCIPEAKEGVHWFVMCYSGLSEEAITAGIAALE